MLKTLEIHNFKSIKELSLPCKRFNIFIGEPGTGKSNLLEALGLLSFVGTRQYDSEVALDGFVRHERTSNLFYDEEASEPMSVQHDAAVLDLAYRGDHYTGGYRDGAESLFEITGGYNTVSEVEASENPRTISILSYHFPTATGFGGVSRGRNPARTIRQQPVISWLRRVPRESYSVRNIRSIRNIHQQPVALGSRKVSPDFLLPPHGKNLPSLLMHSQELRHAVNLPFVERGLRLGLRPQENKIELVKSIDDIIISYPYSLASETLQRLTFYTAAILTNKESVLVFEEPEAHSFLNHTKYLSEQIALDENGNQYFIATHNPYFLMPLLSKARQDDIAINIVYYDDYQTKVKTLQQGDLPELFELNIFANLDRYIEA